MNIRPAAALWFVVLAVSLMAAAVGPVYAQGATAAGTAAATPGPRPRAAGVGLTEIAGRNGDGPITVFYPTAEASHPVQRGPFTLEVAENAAPAPGRGRLIVISHGSGGSPWPHAPLAMRMVAAGFTVALPEHRGDNWRDSSAIGPASWKERPLEVSRAIDAVLANPRFGSFIDAHKVGMWGMSAGGHTALVLAGGRWSPSRLLAHCEAALDEDFASCAGPGIELTGGPLDGVKRFAVRTVIRHKLDDSAWYGHTDPRIVAIVADVPFAADFDMATLARPVVPLGLMRAGADPWLVPRFHIDAVIAACGSCERLSDLPRAGHGSLLWISPLALSGRMAELLGDPPGFDRALVAPADASAVDFFLRRLP